MATYMRIGAVGASKSDIQIRGDVSEEEHDGWIELSGFSFGSSALQETGDDDEGGESSGDGDKGKKKSAKVAQSGGGDESKDPSDRFRQTGFSLTKWDGADSPKILDWALSGKPYDIQVDCCNENGEPFMRFFLTEVRVLSFTQEMHADETTTETLKLLFDTIAFESTGFTKEELRKTPTRVSTKSSQENVATRSGAGPRVAPGAGKGVGKRAQPTAAAEAATRMAERVRLDNENPDFIQEDRVLAIEPIGGVEFELGQFVGSEEMSGLFHFSLEVTSTDLDLDASAVIGKPAEFRIIDHRDIDGGRKSPTREFHGVVSAIHAGQTAVDHRDYTLIIVPSLWFLTKRSNCRVFQKKSVVEIVEDVFNDAGFKDYEKASLGSGYPKLEYCVQYRESDFDFVSRLLEEHGIFYFFRFAKGKHTMVLADASTAHKDGQQKEVIQSTGSIDGKRVQAWIRRLSQISGAMRFRDYNHTTPKETLESQASSRVNLPGVSKYEVYDYPGRYPTVGVGRDRARMAMEAEEVSHCIVDGDGNLDSFACGTTFTITDHESGSEKGEYVLTGVIHQAYAMPMSDIKARIYYENEFECIPKSVTYRPARLTPKPYVRGLQTAIVVGKAGEEIDPDKYGSVKVQFPWDRQGKKDENSSCFVRVAQSIAGKKWGELWLPRIGQEVVVEFLEGDPDRPLITGSVYNHQNQPPYDLPASKTMSGVKTRSTKGGEPVNCNELHFEDKKGEEKVYFHAEKDFHRVVENNDTIEVGTDGVGDQSITVQHDRQTTILHNDTLTVGKDAEGDQSITVEHDRTTQILNDDTITIGKDGAGNQTVTIEKDRTTTINEGNELVGVTKGDRTVNVDAGKDTLNVDGDRAVTVKSGNETLDVKTGNRTTTVDKGDDTLVVKLGDHTTKVNAGAATTQAMKSIELKVGSSSIKIDAKGVTIKGGILMIDGQISTDVKGLKTTVMGSAMLQASGGILKFG